MPLYQLDSGYHRITRQRRSTISRTPARASHRLSRRENRRGSRGKRATRVERIARTRNVVRAIGRSVALARGCCRCCCSKGKLTTKIETTQNERVCAARLPGLHWATAPPPTRTARPTNFARTATTLEPGRSRSPDNDTEADPVRPRETRKEKPRVLRLPYWALLFGASSSRRGGRPNSRDRAPGHVTLPSRGNTGNYDT